uniref:F-box protein n=1 Tax=Davidia involucrata TaxID=16924 RepID=A0A5B7C296_DAVIN
MSNRIIQSYQDGDGRAGQSMHSNQSVWMAHWTQASCNTGPQVHSHLSHHPENKAGNDNDAKQRHLPSGLGIASGIPTSTKGFREVTEAGTVKIMNGSLTTSSKNLRNERLDCQPFPMFNLCRNTGSSSTSNNDQDTSCHRLALKPEIDRNFEYNTIALGTSTSHFPSVLAVAPPETETSSRVCHFQPEGISHNLEDQVNSHKFIGASNLAVARPSQDDFTGSTPHIVPYRFNRGKTPVSSFMHRQEEMNQLSSNLASKEHFSNTNLTILGHEHCNYHSHSAFLLCEKMVDKSGKSGNSFLRQNNASLSLHDPSSSNNHLPVFVGDQCQKMQNYSGIEFFPSRSSPVEASKSEKLYHGCYSVQRMPHSVHGMETMRICTTVDGLPEGPPKFSQTTHSFLITKTDVNESNENQTLRESRVSTNLKRNSLGELLSLSPLFGQGQRGVKLQPLGSSTDSEEKDNVVDVKTSEVHCKNESSTETDTMDMDAFKEENHLSGVNSSESNEYIMVGQNPSSQTTIASSREEVRCRGPLTGLPDINEELPALPAAASSMDNVEPSTSRTQSLDMEHLISHAEQLSNSKSSLCPDGPLRTDPGSRWIKRLKLNASDSFALGTKSSNLGEASSHEKVNKLFIKIMKGSITSSEPTLGKRHGKEVMALDPTAVLLRNGESSSVDSSKKGCRDIMLSHSWIQRWCHNRAATLQKKPEAVVVCEPQSSKVALDELQKKQFPSVAALALMGKAMNGFRPCQFQKRGSFVVWNTKNF